MIAKDKMFIVAGNIDDSIKSVTPIYDISIFPNFLKLEDYINKTPIVLGTIIVSERELPFTGTNMARLLDLLSAPFLKLTGRCIYLISESTSKEMVMDFLEDNQITTITAYQGDLSPRFISDVVSGSARIADESETEIITYRMRASEYAMSQSIKKYESDSGQYITDEEQLSNIPSMPEPMVEIPSVDIQSSTYYVVGKPSYERTLFAFIEAQYLALTGKVLLVESDVQYHRLTDMAKRADFDIEFIEMFEFLLNPSAIVDKIKFSQARLIILCSIQRINYDYDFIFDILTSNLTGWVDYFIKECDFSQTPYGEYYNIVCADTIPDILECCNSLLYDVNEEKCIMVGVRTNYKTPVNVTSQEMTDIVRTVLDKNTLTAEVVEANGINLKGDEVIYDVFSIITRGNEVQSGGL